jgi:hypothetical protein
VPDRRHPAGKAERAGPVRIQVQPVVETVMHARAGQRAADAKNAPLAESRIATHLAVAERVLDTLRDEHRRLVEETDFDPLQKTRQGAAWLLAGRCLSLGYSVVAALAAGLTTDMAPLARTLHEASGALRIMLDPDETALHGKWLRDGYLSAKDLVHAQKRMEDRSAVEMLKQGVAPPGRTDELDHQLYGHWSKIAHNRRSGILESYRSDLRDFAYGPHPDPLRRGVWTGYGTEVISELTVTVGAALAKMLGPSVWTGRIEPAIDALNRAKLQHPLDPTVLGFNDSER